MVTRRGVHRPPRTPWVLGVRPTTVVAMEPIRLAGPADVLAVLPYQLGYHPSESLVAIALHERQIGLVERIDLPPQDAVEDACTALVPPLLREEPDAVLLVGYESRPGDALPLADAVRDALVAAEVPVLDRLVVRDGRWYAPDCDHGCCPSVGHEQDVPRDVPAVAQFVALEVAPLPGRESLAQLVAADPSRTPAVAAALEDIGARADGRSFGGRAVAVHRLRHLATWAKVLDVAGADQFRGAFELGPEEVALLVAGLRDVELRDAVIAWVCPGTLPFDALSVDLVDALHSCLPEPAWLQGGGERAAVGGRRVLSRLQAVARAVPDDDCAAVLTVLANLAWWLGDGALTRVALDRALQHHPGYRLARLLERMVDLGVRSRPAAEPPPRHGFGSVPGGLSA
ncbi:hypothetical protein ASD62_04725 [Phycicoccus sp. Root563]|nr:hypothetical protein ASD62_04725 [Phycicoccus sp. Root563]